MSTLVAAGRPVSVLGRRPRPVPGVTTTVGDLGDAGTWPAALEGVDGVVVSVEPPEDAVGAEVVVHGLLRPRAAPVTLELPDVVADAR